MDFTDEELRQQIIRDQGLGAGREPAFDRLAVLATRLFQVPTALITVLGSQRQFFQGACGIEADGTARSDAFCNYTVSRNAVFVVEDAAEDPRFRDNPLVTGEPFMRFYAGAPISTSNGVLIGSLCLLASWPRELSQSEGTLLTQLAEIVSDVLKLRAEAHLHARAAAECQGEPQPL